MTLALRRDRYDSRRSQTYETNTDRGRRCRGDARRVRRSRRSRKSRWGQTYAQQINAQLPIVTDPEVNRYINVLGDSIAKLADERSLDWQFYVVDSRK